MTRLILLALLLQLLASLPTTSGFPPDSGIGLFERLECKSWGVFCSGNQECCSTICAGSSCTCIATGDTNVACTQNSDCCSGNCNGGSRCVCSNVGSGICGSDGDCCGGTAFCESGSCSNCYNIDEQCYQDRVCCSKHCLMNSTDTGDWHCCIGDGDTGCSKSEDCCWAGSFCDAGKCVGCLPLLSGTPCVNQGDCCSGGCFDSVCKLIGNDSPIACHYNSDCLSNNCVGGPVSGTCKATCHDIGGNCTVTADCCTDVTTTTCSSGKCYVANTYSCNGDGDCAPPGHCDNQKKCAACIGNGNSTGCKDNSWCCAGNWCNGGPSGLCQTCIPNGQACFTSSMCCSLTCGGNLPGSPNENCCLPVGQTCGSNADCCSFNCEASQCAAPLSTTAGSDAPSGTSSAPRVGGTHPC